MEKGEKRKRGKRTNERHMYLDDDGRGRYQCIGRRRERVSRGAQGGGGAFAANATVVRHPVAADEILCVSKPKRRGAGKLGA